MRATPMLLVVLVMLLLPVGAQAAEVPQTIQVVPAPLCFDAPGVPDCVDPLFRAYWEANGGLPVFGYPLGPALAEQTADGLWTTQHFERNRLELHPDVPKPFNIQLGRLGVDRLAQIGRDWTEEPTGVVQPGCRYFRETFHPVCEPFLTYWQGQGLDLGDSGVSERESLALWGLPITQLQSEKNSSDDEVLTQWFERGRFEQHGNQVLLGRLGAEVDAVRRPTAAPTGMVRVRGDQLVVGDQPIKLKGINYYPAQHPWSLMWRHWDGTQVDRDLGRIARELEANTVRILVPYRKSDGWTDDRGTVNPVMLDRLKQFVQLAGNHRLKVIITLFDWKVMLDPPSRPYERAYLQTIVGAFRDDDRVLAWDLHNEPDHYADWAADTKGVISWVTDIADELRAIDRQHPITVGVGKPETLWHAGRDGRTILDVVDFVSVHNYDANTYRTIFDQVRQRTAKPILLEEFGWPSGPECILPFHDEASQLYLFRQVDAALDAPGVVGALSWWLQDPKVTPWTAINDENAHFGLYRVDGSVKPAFAVLRSWPVPPLPSQTNTQLAITVAPLSPIKAVEQPIYFGDYMLWGSFKHFWNFFGGERTFGKPIGNMYRDQKGLLIQYFERARFELNESLHVQPIDPEWAEGQTPEVYLDRVHLAPLGRQLTANRSFPTVPDPKLLDVRFFPQTGHTVRGAFRTLWETHGEIFFGLPLSEELVETIDGQAHTVQYFTHWRMERLPDGSVRLGDLGGPALAQRPCVRGW